MLSMIPKKLNGNRYVTWKWFAGSLLIPIIIAAVSWGRVANQVEVTKTFTVDHVALIRNLSAELGKLTGQIEKLNENFTRQDTQLNRIEGEVAELRERIPD